MHTAHRFIPHLTDEQIREKQLEGLRYTLRQARNSPQYRARLDKCGLRVEDVKSLDDLRLLPTVDVEDLREGYPLPLLCVPQKDVVRIHASSGDQRAKAQDSGLQPPRYRDLQHAVARCYELAGLTPEDRMQVAVGYGLWTAGAGFQLGSERFGMLTIPVGPGNLEMHLQLLRDVGATCFGATGFHGPLAGRGSGARRTARSDQAAQNDLRGRDAQRKNAPGHREQVGT